MFSGSIVAIVTPFRGRTFDRKAYADLIEFQIANGTSGIVPVGTTGESATLSHEEHKEVIRCCIDVVRKRVPVIAGAGSNATAEALELTQAAKDLGADASLHITPYYNKPTQEGLYRHFKTIAEAVALPLVVYDCPSRTGVSVAPETVARLSAVKNIVALKDAEGNLDYTSAVRSLCDITILSGNDSLNLPILAVGGKGAISVLANVAPRATADLIGAFLKGDAATAEKLHRKWFPLCKSLFIESNPIPVKAALEMMGMIGGELRPPLYPISDKNREVLRKDMAAAGLLK
ncbi:MAG: 4-hydroxy-tetrahydrodipicolinate synthase [Candidatus Sumerlaeota bacterium]|nr:4-hydroxy-tetrahydrodipicolinate synthase [Candidatus Sumerlaeota bacterium]